MNTPLPLVSIVVPAWNEEKYVADCIASIKEQKTDFPFELIVIDNASTDRTGDVASYLGARVVKENKKGLSFARQRGLDVARGKYIIYIDADVRIPKGWLARVIDYMQTNKDVVGASCNFHFYDVNGLDVIGQSIFKHIVVPAMIVFLRLFGKPDVFYGSAMTIRRDVLQKAGGINLQLEFYGEDVGIAVRLNKFGKVRLLEGIEVAASGRRAKGIKGLKTLFLYWKSFIFVIFGNESKVVAYSKEYKY